MFGMQFSPDVVEMAIDQITSDDINAQTDGLMILSTVLISVSPDEIGNFGLERVISPLCDLFSTASADIIEEQAALCLRNILSVTTDAIFPVAKAGFIQAACAKLDQGCSIELAENCIHCFNSIANYTASTLGKVMGLDVFFRFLDFLTTAEQRTSLQTVKVMTEYYERSDYVNYLPNLCSLVCNPDRQIAEYCIASINNIINRADLNDFPINNIDSLSTAITVTNSSDLVYDILIVLIKLSNNLKCAEAIAKTQFNYERLLFSKDFPESRLEIIQKTLILFAFILPRPKYPENVLLNEHTSPSNALEFSRNIRNLIVRHIIENNNNELISISNLTACLNLEQFDLPSDVFIAISGYANKPENVVVIMEFASNVKDKSKISLYGISDTLSRVKPKNNSNLEWYEAKLNDLLASTKNAQSSICEGKKFESLSGLVSFINNNKFSSVEFFKAGLASEFHKLAKQHPDAVDLDLKRSYQLFEEIATFLPVYEEKDLLEGQNIARYPFIAYSFKLQVGEDIIRPPEVVMTSLFTSLEFWYNINVLDYSVEKILTYMRSKNEILRFLELDQIKTLTNSQLGLLCRIIRPPEYKFFTFEIKGHKFSALSECFTSISRLCSSLKEVFDGNVIIKLEEIDLDNDVPLELVIKHELITGEMQLALSCLSDIRRLSPTMELKSAKLEKRMTLLLQSPVLSMSFFSPAISIIRRCPFLFTEQLKFYIFQVASLDFFSALCHASKTILKSSEKFKDGRVTFQINISRESLFDDGLSILKTYGPGPSQLVIAFTGEAGYGSGPLREFMTMMSYEFMKKERNMWRNEDTSSSPYCFTKNGLFPSPTAKPELFEALGILFAKALASDVVLPIPLSSSFMRLVKGEKITVGDVDQVLQKSLESADSSFFGMQFTYPGYGEFELCEKGADKEVNAENIAEFKKLIAEHTIDRNVMECVNRFKRGFSLVAPSPMWEVLTAHELLHLLTGKEVNITIDDLIESVEVEHGFTKTSPQISMLFEIVSQMTTKEQSLFVKFITGSERLPIGGIGSLQPRISIARKTPGKDEMPDWLLPSVSTCSHYLKIPAYSSIEIMKEKLRYAIYEGQEAFLLT